MLRVGLIAVEDAGLTDRGERRVGGLLVWSWGVEVTIHY